MIGLIRRSIIIAIAAGLLSMTGIASSEAASEGEDCGTLAGIQCDAGLFCEFEANSCGVADRAGVCTVQPTDCKDFPIQQVCSCDGKEYENDCLRQMAGASKLKDGPCP